MTMTTMTTCEWCGAYFSSGLLKCMGPMGVTSPTALVPEWASQRKLARGECPRCGHVTPPTDGTHAKAQ